MELCPAPKLSEAHKACLLFGVDVVHILHPCCVKTPPATLDYNCTPVHSASNLLLSATGSRVLLLLLLSTTTTLLLYSTTTTLVVVE